MKTDRVFLIGFRGAGKTTLGKQLAALLEWTYISTDEEVEKRSGQTIAELVGTEGWPAFRRREKTVLVDLKQRRGAVIDCGGGVVDDPDNLGNLPGGSLIVWVDAPFRVLFRRLQKVPRPLLSGKNLADDIRENYNRRRPFYRARAVERVDTSLADVETLCRQIIGFMNHER